MLSNIDIAVKYIPMESVGGDYYDFHIIDEQSHRRFYFRCFRAWHRGRPDSVNGENRFRIVEQLADRPVELLNDMNRMLIGNMGTHFLTAAYFYLDMDSHILKYARAGHEPLVIYRRSTGEYIKEMPRGRAIGFLKTGNSELLELKIQSGDRIFLYTDGIIEAMNTKGEMYGSKRLMEKIIEQKDLSALDLTDYLLSEMFRWTGRSTSLDDDFSLVVVDIK